MRFKFGRMKIDQYFRQTPFTESTEVILNPGIGWYRIYTYRLEEEISEAELKAVSCAEEKLALLLLDIGFFRDLDLNDAAIDHFERILAFFQNDKKDIILRIVYDTEGKGMLHEPSDIRRIERHMQQLGASIRRFADGILTLQGLFIGSWGEMHSSRFLSEDSIRYLTQVMKEATGGCCRISVRRPKYLRMILSEREVTDDINIGLYNDAMLASESDLGTYGIQSRKQTSWNEEWSREDELDFQNAICTQVPNGGEVVGNHSFGNMMNSEQILKRMHISYLNSIHDICVLNQWKNETYNQQGIYCGKNGYEYIGAHLGYRFHVSKTALICKKDKKIITISITNTGYANAYDEMKATVIFQQKDQKRMELMLPIDLKAIDTDKTRSASIEWTEEVKAGTKVLLQLKRCKDNQCVSLANQEAGECLVLGEFLIDI